MVFTV